jgi:hypothetical protein
MASDVQYQVQVDTVSSTGQNSIQATRLITPSYGFPLTPTFTVTPVGEYLLLAITNPESGSRPNVLTNEVWKRESGAADYQRVAVDIPNDGTYRDYAVAQGKAYDYFVRAVF